MTPIENIAWTITGPATAIVTVIYQRGTDEPPEMCSVPVEPLPTLPTLLAHAPVPVVDEAS